MANVCRHCGGHLCISAMTCIESLKALVAQRDTELAAMSERVARLEAELADVRYMDEIGCKFGTQYDRLDLPAEIPGLDEDHMHFVMMPIGPVSRRASVAWLQARLGLIAPDGKGETNG